MRVYLDICCLERPFDDQTQARIHMESEAVLALLSASPGVLEFVRGPALDLENDQNPLPHRAARVAQWLAEMPRMEPKGPELETRTAELMLLGFRNFDAFHPACAERASADVLCTCDDRFLGTAGCHGSALRLRVVNPIDLAREVFK